MADPTDAMLKTSAERLWALVRERSAPDADIKDIDSRIWDLFGETWAVVFTDLSGFSRHVDAFGILHFLQIIFEHKRVLAPIIHAHNGVLIKTEADSMLMLFRRPEAALRCCLAMLDALDVENQQRPPETQMLLCLGIGFGPVLRIGDEDVYGQEVNAASKLGEDTARAREILITDAAKNALGDLNALGVRAEPINEAVAGSQRNYRVVRHTSR